MKVAVFAEHPGFFNNESESRNVVGGAMIWHKPSLLWAVSASNRREGMAGEDPGQELDWDGEESDAPVATADRFVNFPFPEVEDDALRPVLRKFHPHMVNNVGEPLDHGVSTHL